MDESTADMYYQTDEPEYEQYDDNRPEQSSQCSSFRAGAAAMSRRWARYTRSKK